MKAKGLAYGAGGAFLVLVGALYDRPALCLIGALPLVLVSLHSRAALASNLRIERNFDVDVRRFEGDDVPIEVMVESRMRGVRVMEFRDELPAIARVARGSNHQVAALRRGDRVTLTYGAVLPRFGVHPVGPLGIRVEDPFGFTMSDLQLGGHRAVPVEPRAAELDGGEIRSVVPQAFLGQYEVSQPGSGFDFFGLRDYNRADRMRDVNWKATARAGKLIVNQHVRESKADVVLLLDARATETTGDPVFCPWAQSGRVAVQVAEELLRRRDNIRVATYGTKLEETRLTGNARQIRGLIETLITTTPQGDYPLSLALEDLLPTLAPRSPVILFSSLLEDSSMGKGVLSLLAQGCPVVLVVPLPRFPDGFLSAEERLLLEDRDVLIQDIRGAGAVVVTLDPPTPEEAP